jgi:hypothetical protein
MRAERFCADTKKVALDGKNASTYVRNRST